MSLQSDKFKHYSKNDRVSASDLNAVRNVVAKLARSAPATGITDSTGNIASRRRPYDKTEKLFLWKVVSVGSEGDGVYICSHQRLDNWNASDGSVKHANRFNYSAWLTATAYTRTSYVENDGEIYWCVLAHTSGASTEPGTGGSWTTYWRSTQGKIFNIYENDPPAAYSRALAKGDLMVALPVLDADGSGRWMGFSVSGSNVRLAITTENAPGDDNIICNLLDAGGSEIASGLGSGIDVYCNISGGSALNAAIPRLSNNDQIMVTNIQGKWWCTTVFQTTEDCDCYTAP
ncbi:hypothetical protein LCGC14_1024140 [marine sediment metagenome]|uniref:Uncharacterized protein n=1 Tax=marine sediment metagenome TaxID=412755 RepID=A0A0F9NI53_9ZZZZ